MRVSQHKSQIKTPVAVRSLCFSRLLCRFSVAGLLGFLPLPRRLGAGPGRRAAAPTGGAGNGRSTGSRSDGTTAAAAPTAPSAATVATLASAALAADCRMRVPSTGPSVGAAATCAGSGEGREVTAWNVPRPSPCAPGLQSYRLTWGSTRAMRGGAPSVHQGVK